MIRKLHPAASIMSILLALSSASFSVMAETPVGLWTTYENDGQTPNSLVQISEEKDKLTALIVKILIPEIMDKRCTACVGINKDQRLQGLKILWNLEPIEPHIWGNGEVLDPDNGKIYSAKITLLDNGDKLEVRGYLGIPLIGRSQIWNRARMNHQSSY